MSESIIFGAGCFWCTEAIFKSLRGVKSVTPGYAGGTASNPSYEQVCSGSTGHAEVTQIIFDPEIIPLSVLLDVFWHTHDPTSVDRQGNDTGPQYRSVIFYSDPAQKSVIDKSIKDLHRVIATEVKPLDHFYPAQNYHHDYYARNQNQPYCRLVISPKLQHLRQQYSQLLN